MIRNDYDYLFKYILIGDTSTFLSLFRCREVLHAYATALKQIQKPTRTHTRSLIWI